MFGWRFFVVFITRVFSKGGGKGSCRVGLYKERGRN